MLFRTRLHDVCMVATILLAICGAAQGADDLTAMQEHYVLGLTAHDAGNYRLAVEEFFAAYKAAPRPNLLQNIGRAFEKWADETSGAAIVDRAIFDRAILYLDRSIFNYETYFRVSTDEAERKRIEAKLRTLREKREAVLKAQAASTVPPAMPALEPVVTPPVVTPPVNAPRVQPPGPTPSPAALPEGVRIGAHKRWYVWVGLAGALVTVAGVAVGVAYAVPKDASVPPTDLGAKMINF